MASLVEVNYGGYKTVRPASVRDRAAGRIILTPMESKVSAHWCATQPRARLEANGGEYRPDAAGLGRAQKPFLWLGATQGNPLPLHIAFAADNRTQVDQF